LRTAAQVYVEFMRSGSAKTSRLQQAEIIKVNDYMTQPLETYEEIGTYFKNCRESMGVTIERASAELHIRAKYLVAMESGRMKDMPGSIYARGYVQQYAEYLRLDPIFLLHAFDQASGRIKREAFFIPEPTRKHNMPSPRLIGVSLVLMVLLVGFWLLFQTNAQEEKIAKVQDLPQRYERIINPVPEPPLNPDARWRSCFLLVENWQPMCQSQPEEMTIPVTLLTPLRQFSTEMIVNGR
jgi:hypothetical protein